MKATQAAPIPTMVHTNNSWIEVRADVIGRNIENLRAYFRQVHEQEPSLGPPPRIAAVVKGNAYGHGWSPMVQILESIGLDTLTVFAGHEAIDAAPHISQQTTLQVMGYIAPSEVPHIVRAGYEPWIGNPIALRQILSESHHQERTTSVHVEVETGMNRTGLPFADAVDACRVIIDDDHMELAGVCSHLAGAEDSRNNDRIGEQHGVFRAFLEALDAQGIDPGTRHLASSSAALLYPEMHYDLVRIGIGTYGFWPTPEVRYRLALGNAGVIPLQLSRALSWYSRVMLIREVDDGEYVGYGHGHEMSGDGLVAIIPVGYADGFSRSMGNQAQVLIHGRRCPIIGHVNMNMIQVLVSHIPTIAIGDKVTLIGKDGNEEIGVSSFSDYNNIVNYEVMTRLSPDIPRTLVKDIDEASEGP